MIQESLRVRTTKAKLLKLMIYDAPLILDPPNDTRQNLEVLEQARSNILRKYRKQFQTSFRVCFKNEPRYREVSN